MTTELDRYWSPELATSIRRIQNQDNNRVIVGTGPCTGYVRTRRHPPRTVICTNRMVYFSGDPRARGWWRFECTSCGEWGDAQPDASPNNHPGFMVAA